MVYEIAQLTIEPHRSIEFEAAVCTCVPLFRRAKGCTAMMLERVVEEPGCYILRVAWNTVDDHMVGFRGSDDFAVWRSSVGSYFTAPPRVSHVEQVIAGF